MLVHRLAAVFIEEHNQQRTAVLEVNFEPGGWKISMARTYGLERAFLRDIAEQKGLVAEGGYLVMGPKGHDNGESEFKCK